MPAEVLSPTSGIRVGQQPIQLPVVLSRVSHPRAGATTLLVSLGIIAQPKELVIIEVAVFLLTAQALAINRLAALPVGRRN